MHYASDAFNEPFPTSLRQIMTQNGTSQQTLADAIGIKRQSVSQYCNGTAQPAIDKICLIADYFKVTIDFLLRGIRAQNTDMHQATGLSDAAIQALRNFYTENGKGYIIDAEYKCSQEGITGKEAADIMRKAHEIAEEVNTQSVAPLSKALASPDFLACVASFMSIEGGERGYYESEAHEGKPKFYKLKLSPDSYAAMKLVRLNLIANAIRTGDDLALQSYLPHESD